MENTTTNNDIIEVITDLNVSDIKSIDLIIDKCLQINVFAQESIEDVKQLSVKVKILLQNLEKQL